MKEVKKIEGRKPDYVGEKEIGWDDEIYGVKCRIKYAFEDDKLVSVRYIFEPDDVEQETYHQQYCAINLILDEKYGEPDVRVEDVAKSRLTSVWNFKNLIIIHIVDLADWKPMHQLFYSHSGPGLEEKF